MEIEVTGVLLAGGKSRRMGEDKRYLVVGDQTLLERGLVVLRSIFQEVLVVIAQDSPPLDVDTRVVRDLVPDCGSLGGLYTGLYAGNNALHIRGRMRHAVSRSGGHCPVHESKSHRRYCDGETRGKVTSDACVVWQTMPAGLRTDDPGPRAQDPRDSVARVPSSTLCHRSGSAHPRSLRAFLSKREYTGGS